MVTCKVDSAQLIKMNRRSGSSMASTSSGFRLLDSDQNNNFDTISSISRNSIYKQKIDLMFDDSRFVYKYYSLVGRTCLGGLMSQMFQLKCREQRHNFRVHLPILVTVRRPRFPWTGGWGTTTRGTDQQPDSAEFIEAFKLKFRMRVVQFWLIAGTRLD